MCSRTRWRGLKKKNIYILIYLLHIVYCALKSPGKSSNYHPLEDNIISSDGKINS